MTAGLGWYFRLLDLVGVSEMDEVFTLEEIRGLAKLAATLSPVEAGGLVQAKAVLVDGLKSQCDHDLARKISGLSPAAVIWLWDRLTILLAHPAGEMDVERVSALFKVREQ